MGGLDRQSEPASVGGNQVATLSEIYYKAINVYPPSIMDVAGFKAIAEAYNQYILEELNDLKNICMMEGVTVSGLNRVIGTHIARIKSQGVVIDLANNNPEASAELSNPPKESL